MRVGTKLLNQISGVALNDATEANRTITLTLPTRVYLVRLLVRGTYAASTDITITPSASADGTNYHSWTSRSTSSGTGTLSVFTDVMAFGGADKDFITEYDVSGMSNFKAVFSDSGSQSDVISVDVIIVSEVQ